MPSWSRYTCKCTSRRGWRPAHDLHDRRRSADLCRHAAARAGHPAARRRALAGDAVAAAYGGAARPLYRLPVRQRHHAVGDRHPRRRARPFRRIAEFRQCLARRHLSRRGMEHLRLYPCRHGVQARARLVAGGIAQQQLQGEGLYQGLYPVAVHHSDGAVDPRLEVDVRPDLQRDQLGAVPARADPRPDQLARRPRSGIDLGHHRQCLARRAVFCDQPARRAADDQPRIARGRGDRRRPRVAALSCM